MKSGLMLLPLLLCMSACQQEEVIEEKPIRPAQVWEVTQQVFEEVDSYTGTVEPRQRIDLSFRVAGKLTGRHVNVGDYLEVGKEVARLDNSDSELQVNNADANLQAAQGEVESNRANLAAVQNNYAAQQGVLASTQSNLVSARGNLSAARGNVAAIQASQGTAQAALESAYASHRSAQANYNASKAAIEAAQAELNNAQANYARTADLLRQKFISRAIFDQDQQRLQTARANLRSAQAQSNSLLEQVKSALAQVKARQAEIKTTQAQIAAAQGELKAAQANVAALQGQVKTAQAQANAAKAQIDIAQSQVKTSEARMGSLQSQTQLAQNQSKYTVLRNTSAGVVTQTYVEPGQVVAAGQAIIQLAVADQFEVHIRVGESVIQTLKPGMAATVRLWADSDESLAATVGEISPVAAESRTWLVKLDLKNVPETLKLGMTARVLFRSPLNDQMAWLPSTALFQQQRDPAVWLVDENNQVQLQVIKPRKYLTNGMLVTGLEVGSKVVTAGVNRLYEGQMIIPVPYDGNIDAQAR